MNKQRLASKIWESANKMRSKIEANEYKDYILGFIFYKFLSDKELKYLRENDWTDEFSHNLQRMTLKRLRVFRETLATLFPTTICSPHGLPRGSTSLLRTLRMRFPLSAAS